ncbi:unnamed protein product, partial [Medioppia subpectinata]
WLINGTGAWVPAIIHMDIQAMTLNSRDLLRVTTRDGKSVLYEHYGQLEPGVILLPTGHKVVRVTLTLSSDPWDRKWDVDYNTKDLKSQLTRIDSPGRYVFPYSHRDMKFPSTGLDFDLVFESRHAQSKLLMSMEPGDLNGGTIRFYKVEKYGMEQLFDSNTTRPEFLLSTGQQIVAMIRGYRRESTSSANIRFMYEVVDSQCSQYKQNNFDITQTDNVPTVLLPDNQALQTLHQYKCVNIYEHHDVSARFELQLDRFKSFINSADIMTVSDGLSQQCPPLAVIERQLLDTYWRTKYLQSTANTITVTYESRRVVNTTLSDDNLIGIQTVYHGGNYKFLSDELTYQLRIDMNTSTHLQSNPGIYTFETDNDHQLVLELNASVILPGSSNQPLFDVYNNVDREVSDHHKLIRLYSGSYGPSIIPSNTNQLKLVFHQRVDYQLVVRQVLREGNCNTTAAWHSITLLMPGRPDRTNTSVILRLTQVNHATPDDWITLYKGSAYKEQGYESSIGVINIGLMTSMPDVILAANETYTLQVWRSDNVYSVRPLLVTLSVEYTDRDVRDKNMTFSDHELTVSTQNHPGNYPVGSIFNWQMNGEISTENGPNWTMALITFSDIELAATHSLSLNNQLYNRNYEPDKMPADMVLPLPFNITMDTRIIVPPYDPMLPPYHGGISGRGIKARITPGNCGGAYTVRLGQQITIKPVTTGSQLDYRCVLTITAKSYPDQYPYATDRHLVINYVTYISEGTQMDVYDSETRRGDRKFSPDRYDGRWQSTSTNTMVIVLNYTDDRRFYPPTFTVKARVCDKMCDNDQRCLLTNFRCDGVNDCGDWSDERDCNPMPTCPPRVTNKGAWIGWIALAGITTLLISGVLVWTVVRYVTRKRNGYAIRIE